MSLLTPVKLIYLLILLHEEQRLSSMRGKGKGQVVPVLLSTEYHAMKAYCGSRGTAPLIL
jgi:hypothetical protein